MSMTEEQKKAYRKAYQERKREDDRIRALPSPTMLPNAADLAPKGVLPRTRLVPAEMAMVQPTQRSSLVPGEERPDAFQTELALANQAEQNRMKARNALNYQDLPTVAEFEQRNADPLNVLNPLPKKTDDLADKLMNPITKGATPEKAVEPEVDIDKWIDPSYKMSDEEKKLARQMVKDYDSWVRKAQWSGSDEDKQKLINIGDLTTPEGQEAQRMNLLRNKSSLLGNFMQGAVSMYENIANPIQDKLTEAIPMSEQDREAARELNERQSYARRTMNAGAETQNPLAFGAGKLANQAMLYTATSGATGAAAAAIGAKAAAGALGNFAINQGLQFGQDLALDTLPTYLELKDRGLSDEEIRNELGKGMAINAGMNLGMGVLGEIPGLIKNAKNAKQLPQLDEAAKMQEYYNSQANPTIERQLLDELNASDRRIAEEAAALEQPKIPQDMLEQARAEQAMQRRIAEEAAARESRLTSDMIPQEAPRIEPAETPSSSFKDIYGDIPTAHRGTAEKVGQDLYVKRYAEPDAVDSGKPQGLFVSNEHTKSPHADPNAELRHYKVDPNANMYDVQFNGSMRTDRGYTYPDVNVGYLVDQLGVDEVQRLYNMEKADLQKYLKELYPSVKWDQFYDKSEMLMGYGGIKAKENGIDVLRNLDEDYGLQMADPDLKDMAEDFSEMSVLNDDVLKRIEDSTIEPQVDNTVMGTRRFSDIMNSEGLQNADTKIPTMNEPPVETPPVRTTSDEPNMKVSETYTNTGKNGGGWNKEEYSKYTDPNDYKYETKAEEMSVQRAEQMRREEGREGFKNRVMDAEHLTSEEMDGLMMEWREAVEDARAAEAAGQDATSLWEETNRIFRKVREQSTGNAQALQALAKWSRNTPEGMMATAENVVNKRIKNGSVSDGISKQVKDKINRNWDKAAVEKQKSFMEECVTGYRDFVDRFKKSVDASEYVGKDASLRSLSNSINDFEKALQDGNILRMSNAYTSMKRKANTMAKKGLTLNVDTKGVDEAIENLVKQSKVGGFEFTPDFQKSFIDEAAKLQDLNPDSREFKVSVAKLGDMVGDEIRRNTSAPKLFVQRLTSYLMDSMLGNFRTLISRNAGGNLGLAAVEQFMERPLAAGLDRLVAKKTGVRTQAGFSKEAFKDYLSGFVNGLKEEGQDIKAGLHTSRSGEVSIEDAISRNRHIFRTDSKNTLLKALSKVSTFGDEAVAHGLSVGDRGFYEATYKQTLGDLNRFRANGQLGEGVQKLTDNEFKVLSEGIAKLNGLSAVYQNDSQMAKALIGFKNALGDLSESMVGFDVLSQFSMPFVKTPANVLDKSIDYSPLGFVRNAIRTGKETLGKNAPGLNQNRFVNETARNIIGTGMMGGAVGAAAAGGMSGGYSDDPDEKAAQRDSGMQEYALNLPGGYQMDVSWIPVLGSNAVSAATAYDEYKDGDGNIIQNIGNGLAKGIEKQFEQASLQGMQRVFGGNGYNTDSGFVGNIIDTVQQGVGQGIPALVRQGAQVGDEYVRDVTNSDDLPYWVNSLRRNIPGVRETLAPKVDTRGNLVEESQGRGLPARIAEDMLLPGKITRYEEHPLDAEASRLYEVTNNKTSFMPKADKKDLDKETVSNDEWVSYQQDYGKRMTQAGEALINSDAYKALSDFDKENTLSEVYKEVREAIRAEYNGKEADGAAKTYKEGGAEAVIQYILDKNTLKSLGMSNNEKNREMLRNEGAEAVQQKAEVSAALNELGVTSSTAKNYVSEHPDSMDYIPTLVGHGITSIDAWEKYETVKGDIPQLEYAQTLKAIDKPNKDGVIDGKTNTDDVVEYLNKMGYGQEEGQQIANAYYTGTGSGAFVYDGSTWKYKRKK